MRRVLRSCGTIDRMPRYDLNPPYLGQVARLQVLMRIEISYNAVDVLSRLSEYVPDTIPTARGGVTLDPRYQVAGHE